MTRLELDVRPLRRFLSLALISRIAACGGGTAPTASATPAPAPTPTPVPTPTPNPYAAGLPGPNWFQDVDQNGTLVPCGEAGTDCKLKPENQYLLDIHAPGTYVACGGKGSPGTCGGGTVSPEAWGVIHKNPSGLCTGSS